VEYLIFMLPDLHLRVGKTKSIYILYFLSLINYYLYYYIKISKFIVLKIPGDLNQ